MQSLHSRSDANPDDADDLSGTLAQSDSLAAQVRSYLMSGLTSGRLKPGQRINEAELARQFGISRNPIREAISGLVQRGFLIAVPRKGSMLPTFTVKDVEDIYSFRACIELFALKRAMELMSEEERSQFPILVDEMVEAAHNKNEDRVQHLDMFFHHQICAYADNKSALRAFQVLDVGMRMLLASLIIRTETLEVSAESHRPIADAIYANDRDHALAALEFHIVQNHEYAREAIKSITAP